MSALSEVEALKGVKPPLDYHIWNVTEEYCLFDENGEPLYQSPEHAEAQDRLGDMVQFLLHPGRPGSAIYQDVLMAWDERHPDHWCAPDLVVFPIKPVTKPGCQVVPLWELSSWPIFVLEIASKKSETIDQVVKREIYECRMRIPEYVIYSQEAPEPNIQGYRLIGGHYRPIEPDVKGRILSEQIPCWIGLDDDGKIRLWDTSGQPAMTLRELLTYQKEQTRLAEEKAYLRAEADRHADEAALLRAGAAHCSYL